MVKTQTFYEVTALNKLMKLYRKRMDTLIKEVHGDSLNINELFPLLRIYSEKILGLYGYILHDDDKKRVIFYNHLNIKKEEIKLHAFFEKYETKVDEIKKEKKANEYRNVGVPFDFKIE